MNTAAARGSGIPATTFGMPVGALHGQEFRERCGGKSRFVVVGARRVPGGECDSAFAQRAVADLAPSSSQPGRYAQGRAAAAVPTVCVASDSRIQVAPSRRDAT